MAARPSLSRLILATLAFVAWAPASLVGLPCAALLLIAPQRSLAALPAHGERPGASHVLAGFIGAFSMALLVLMAEVLTVVLPETDSAPSAVVPTTPPNEALPVTDRPCCPAVVASGPSAGGESRPRH